MAQLQGTRVCYFSLTEVEVSSVSGKVSKEKDAGFHRMFFCLAFPLWTLQPTTQDYYHFLLPGEIPKVAAVSDLHLSCD